MYSNHPVDNILFGAMANFLRWIQGKFYDLLLRLEQRKMRNQVIEVRGLTIGDIDDSILKTKNTVVEQTGMDETQQEFLDFIFKCLQDDLAHRLEVNNAVETSEK
jgi:hypothetical protein